MQSPNARLEVRSEEIIATDHTLLLHAILGVYDRWIDQSKAVSSCSISATTLVLSFL